MRIAIFTLAVFFGMVAPAADKPSSEARITEICGRYVFEGEEVSLNSAEISLICGSKETPGWQDVPVNQALFHLKSFLQDRGYFAPEIVEKDKIIHIKLGKPLRVRNFRIVGYMPGIGVDKMRNIRGEVMTPALLDTVKSRLQNHLENQGFPCGSVEMRGFTEEGDIVAEVKTGDRWRIGEILREPLEGVRSNNVSRFDAFRLGDWYSKENLVVTSQRILDVSLVQSTFFAADCRDLRVREYFVAGPPRLFSLGVGADTEQLALVRANWKNSRIWENASQLQASTSASFRLQDLNLDFRWFPLYGTPRAFLRSSFGIKRENYEPYDRMSIKARVAPGITWDSYQWGVEAMMGPAVTMLHTYRGEGRKDITLASLSGLFTAQTHSYEYFRKSPTVGSQVSLDFDLSQEDALSPLTAYRFRLAFENHWNLFDLDPAFVIMSIRGAYMSTITKHAVGNPKIPSEYRHFLGGSPDIRGFALRELPGDDHGSLSAAFFGVENRYPDILPWGLQPFVFADFAMMADSPMSLQGPIYWAPGGGIRWESQVGVFRVNLAKGMFLGTTEKPIRPHWQFYFSFGEEF